MTDEQREARDPSTPPARLVALMAKHLDAVLENPALPLLTLAQPDLWADCKDFAQRELARSPACPLAFAQWAVRQDQPRHLVLTELLMNRSLPPSLRRLAFWRRDPLEHRDYQPDRPAFAEDFLTPDELSLLRGGGVGPKGSADPAMTTAEVEQLAALGRLGEMLALEHPACPPPLLERCFDAGVPVAMDLVPRHPNLPLTRLAWFLMSPHAGTRWYAAQNPQLTPEQLHAAAAVVGLQDAVAQNPSLPRDLFERFLYDPRHAIRLALASNPSLPPDLQLALAARPYGEIHQALRENLALTAEARRRLDERGAG